MDYYTVISSDLYQLSCIAVSQLAPYGGDEVKGDDRFLVSEKLSGDQTKTGYMSKFVTFDGLKEALVDALGYVRVSSDVANLSNVYMKKEDFGYKTISVDTAVVPTPYIISSMHFNEGKPVSADGYWLVSALEDTVICVYYRSLSTHELTADAVAAGSLAVSRLSAVEISNGFMDYISAIVPQEATSANKLADRGYVSAMVVSNASTFRGSMPPSTSWQDLGGTGIYLSDETGSTVPDEHDYMTLSSSTYNDSHPDARIEAGTWRFQYCGVWSDNHQDGWKPEYRIETTPFTEAQKNAIDSGVTERNFVRVNGSSPVQVGGPNTPVYVVVDGDNHSYVAACNELIPLSGLGEIQDNMIAEAVK